MHTNTDFWHRFNHADSAELDDGAKRCLVEFPARLHKSINLLEHLDLQSHNGFPHRTRAYIYNLRAYMYTLHIPTPSRSDGGSAAVTRTAARVLSRSLPSRSPPTLIEALNEILLAGSFARNLLKNDYSIRVLPRDLF